MKRKFEQIKQRLKDPRVGWGTIFLASFLESTVVPIPIEVALVPLMLAAKERRWRIASIALLGTIAGAMAGYVVGFLFWGYLGQPLSNYLGVSAQIVGYAETLRSEGFLLLLSAGVTPIPYQIASVSAGLIEYSIFLFLLATVIARGVRYWGLALLVATFGDRAATLIKKHKKPVAVTTIAVMAAIVLWRLAL